MFYKLGSQLDIYDKLPDGQDMFEWNICLLNGEYGSVNQYIYLGSRGIHDPIVRLARNLVDELNKENKQNG